MKKIIFSSFLFFVIIIPVIIIIIFFVKNNNKINNPGNNKSIDEIEQYLLNINSYKAKIDVTVISNKNENQYKMEQNVTQQYSKMIVTSPEAISNMEIIYENGILQIKNTQLSISKVYNEYPNISKNVLFLTDFIKTYQESENKNIEELDDALYMKVKSENNNYNQNQALRINKQTLKPESLEIQDINNKTKFYILYNEIELNI